MAKAKKAASKPKKAASKPKKSTSKKSAAKPAPSVSEFTQALATELVADKSTAKRFLDALGKVVGDALKSHGVVRVPGLARFTVVKKPARPAGNYTNPFTKTVEHRKAKPASKSVRARPIKAIKDAVA